MAKTIQSGLPATEMKAVKLNASGQPLNPSWREGWHANCRQFIAHQWSDADENEGGDIWRVIDTEGLQIMAETNSEGKAKLLAEALEFLSHEANVYHFEAAMRAL